PEGAAGPADEALDVVGGVGEAGVREADALLGQDLQRAQLVARAGDRLRSVDAVDVHHLELPDHRGAVERVGGADPWDHGVEALERLAVVGDRRPDRKSTRLNSSHVKISYAVFCLKKKKNE